MEVLTDALPDEALVADLDALRVLADGRRHEILTALIHEPLTVRILAERLRLPRTRLYYHIDVLERHGLVRVVQTRMVSGALERTYRAVARTFRVDRRALGAAASAVVDATQASMLHAVADDLQARRKPGRDPLVSRAFLRLTAERYGELEARLHALIAEYHRDDAGGEPAELAFALFALESA
jgi:DNA-binding transcriptional ArsR family regulator